MRVSRAELRQPYVAWGKFLSGSISHLEGYQMDYKQGFLTIKHDIFNRAAEDSYKVGRSEVTNACVKIPASNLKGITPWTARDQEREDDFAARVAADEARKATADAAQTESKD